MKQLNAEEAKQLCDRVLGMANADECSVALSGSRNGNIRFARNSVSTAGLNEDRSLVVTVAYGKRQGTATVNEFDDKSLERAVRRAEDIARLAPENPEYVPMPGKQAFKASAEYVAATAAIDPDYRAEVASHAILAGRKHKLVTAGFFTDSTGFQTIANSKGVFGHRAYTGLNFTCTARTEDGRGSGWVTRAVNIWTDPWDKDVPVSPWDTQAMLERRTWYIRMVDPQSLLLTGLTRDGTFYVENGKIKYPVKNFRFNESPVTMLNNVAVGCGVTMTASHG